MAKAATEVKKDLVEVKAPAEVVTRPGTNQIVAVSPVVEVYGDMVADEETGLEHVSTADRRLPILRILQANSPQTHPPENGGILGAKVGDIFNTSTNEIYDGRRGLYVVGCMLDKKYVRYIKRNDDGSGGGFLGILEPEDPVVKRRQQERIAKYGDLFGKLEDGKTEDGKPVELVETDYLYSILIKPNEDGTYPGEYGEFFSGLVPFASTQMKKRGAWVERNKNMRYMLPKAGGGVAPSTVKMWSHVWRLQTGMDPKKGVFSWYGWRLTLATKNTDGSEAHYSHSRLTSDNPIYKAAEDLRVSVLEGSAQVAFDKDQPADDGESNTIAPSGGAQDDDIPFGDTIGS